MKLSQEQILEISKGDKEIAAFITMLTDRIEQLENRVKDLERQLNQNSKNSSKPPSSDGLRKPTNLRQSGGKKGAPKGHNGHTLLFVDTPDEIVTHLLSTCRQCSASLETVASLDYEKRQVFDLPPPRVQVTEHRAEKKCCPACGFKQRAPFPEPIHAPTQYGEGFATWAAYLHGYQMMPLERIAQLFMDLTGYRPSEATLLSFLQTMYHSLEVTEQTIRTKLFHAPVVHADETGFRIEGKTHWLHTVSDTNWTLLGVHPKRGSQGMDELGFFPFYLGIVVHDCLQSYFKDFYLFIHALCNAHLLRECQGIAEHDGHEWAIQMIELLQGNWKRVQAARRDQAPLSEEVIQAVKSRYDDILERGKEEWEQDVVRAKTGSKGRKIKSKAANLGERLMVHKEPILRFIWDERVPFDNNQAERDIRMVKVKQKVSGSFRTESGAKIFARLRSVISTLLKQNRPVLSSLTYALRGQLTF